MTTLSTTTHTNAGGTHLREKTLTPTLTEQNQVLQSIVPTESGQLPLKSEKVAVTVGQLLESRKTVVNSTIQFDQVLTVDVGMGAHVTMEFYKGYCKTHVPFMEELFGKHIELVERYLRLSKIVYVTRLASGS